MKKNTTNHSETRMGVAFPKAVLIGACTTVLFFNMNVSVHGQANPQATWQAVGSDSVRTSRFVDVNNNLRANNVHILFNVQVDSLLRTMQAIVDHTLSVGSDIMVGGNGTIAGWLNVGQWLNVTGQTQTGSLLVNQNSILGYAEAFKLTADSISATGIFAGTIDAAQYLLNGLPLVSSQWVSSGSDIYFGGKVGINTNTAPSFPLEVHGDAAVTGTIFTDRVAAQTGISIGQFRFINGATQPGQADSIRTAEKLTVSTERALELRAAEPITILSSAEKVSIEANTVRMKERVGIGREPGVALDVAGDIRTTGSLSANTLNVSGAVFDSLDVVDSIKIGNSLIVGGNNIGTNNHIYSDNSPLVLQSNTLYVFNTLISMPDMSNVGIGSFTPTALLTLTPQKKLHLLTVHNIGSNPPANSGVRIEDMLVKFSKFSSTSVWDLHTDGNSMKFFISNPSKTVMTLTDTGNVGIGNTNPQAKLHVNGSVQIDGSEVWTSDGWNTVLKTPLASAAWRSTTKNNANKYMGLGMTTGGWYFIQSAASDNSQPAEYPFVIRETGNVGIGTASPTAKLHVKQTGTFANSQDALFKVHATNTVWAAEVYNNNAYGSGLRVLGAFGNGAPLLQVENAGTGDVLFMVHGNGNVGIGTTGPDRPLHIARNVTNNTDGLLRLSTATDETDFVDFSMLNTITPRAEIQTVINGVATGNIVLQSIAGNVGIGTTHPQAKLHIDGGDVRVTNGKVNIGAPPTNPGIHSDYKLSVEGKIVSKESVVKTTIWADDVYEKNLTLEDMEREEEFGIKNKHLIDIPSAMDVIKNGVNLGEFARLLLQKIEEGRIYMYAMYKVIKGLKKENEELKSENIKIKMGYEDMAKEIKEIKEDLKRLKSE